MMRKKNRKRGSMTVEMAILFPVVFFTSAHAASDDFTFIM